MNSLVSVGRVSLVFALFLAITSIFTGCETLSGGGGDGSGPNLKQGSSDLLHPGEIVIITFSGAGAVDPIPRHEDRIREDGLITLPYIGAIQAAGMTRGELQKEILARYVPRYYKQLTVNVNPDSRNFTVSGEVKIPGRILYLNRTTVLKAIAAAGDFTDFADPKNVQIIRANGKKVKVNAVKARQNPELDLEIYPDDHIFVPRRIF